MTSNVKSNPEDFFLNFGSSSNVCDQLRHSIRDEVNDIDASIIKLEEEKRREDRTCQEMFRSLANSRKEMFSLRQAALDLVDSTNLNETLRARMMHDLQTSLIKLYLIKDDAVEKVEEVGHETSDLNFLENRRNKIKEFLALTHDAKEKAISSLDQVRELENTKSEIELKFERDRLEHELKNAEKEAKEMELELECRKRELTLKNEEFDEMQAKSQDYAQEVTHHVKKLENTKSSFERERSHLVEELKAEDEKYLEAELKKENLKESDRKMAEVVEFLKKQLAEAKAAINDRSNLKKDVDTILKEILELETEALKAEEAVSLKQNEMLVAQKELDDVRLFEEQVLQQKVEIDRIQAEKILPCQAELNDLKKLEEDLLKDIQKVEQEIKEGREKHKGALDANQNILDEIVAKSKSSIEETKVLQIVIEDSVRERNKRLEELNKEISEDEMTVQKLHSLCDSEEKEHQEFLIARENHRTETLQTTLSQCRINHQKLEERYQVYTLAVELLNEVRFQQLELDELQKSMQIQETKST